MNTKNSQKQKKSRLKWACRRGMLELDLILNRFLSSGYDYLDEAEQILFEAMLTREDTELFTWLFDERVDKPVQFLSLIKKMQIQNEIHT